MSAGLRLPEKPLEGIKLVVCDLDGTALTPDKRFSPALLRSFAALRSKGIACTIASARTPMMLGVFCAEAGVGDTPVITLEGAEVINWATGETLYSRPIEPSIAPEIMERCHRAGLDYTIYTESSCYLRRDTRRMWRFDKYNEHARSHALPPAPTSIYEDADPAAIARERVYKIFLDNPTAGEKDSLLEFLSSYAGLRTDCSESASLTIMHEQVSKGNALRSLSKTLRLAPEEICCFGDWYNDIDMLAAFPRSVAMLNGAPEAKSAAAYVTASNTEDGVAGFIDKYILGPWE